MSAPHKPIGYPTVSPYLVVNGADPTIAFLTQVFGVRLLRRVATEQGKVMHAEVRMDDSIIKLGDANPPSWPAVPSHVHVYVPDVDDTYRKALNAGAVSVQKPLEKGDGDRRAAVKDAGGTTWWIATKVA
jgi:PhnB protein